MFGSSLWYQKLTDLIGGRRGAHINVHTDLQWKLFARSSDEGEREIVKPEIVVQLVVFCCSLSSHGHSYIVTQRDMCGQGL